MLFKNANRDWEISVFERAPFPQDCEMFKRPRFISHGCSLVDNGNDVVSPSRWQAAYWCWNSRRHHVSFHCLDLLLLMMLEALLSSAMAWYSSHDHQQLFYHRIQVMAALFVLVLVLLVCHLLSAQLFRLPHVTNHHRAWMDYPIHCPYCKQIKI